MNPLHKYLAVLLSLVCAGVARVGAAVFHSPGAGRRAFSVSSLSPARSSARAPRQQSAPRAASSAPEHFI